MSVDPTIGPAQSFKVLARKLFIKEAVGTPFERSHVPLNKWLMAFHLMAASKKGMSAKQLERRLGVTYKTAWSWPIASARR